MIRLTDEQIQEINKHAEEDYPYECCGILFGQFGADNNKTVTQLRRSSNARQDEAKHNRFLISAEELMRSELYARKHGLDIVGFYHSHPDHPAIPSAFDLEHAWPLYSYIIVSVRAGEAGDLTSWELKHDRSAFNAETIIRGE
ncbi:Mov34/MPN/PAD-1 family protein [Paenibacillus beijingensis]|uniref:Mov34/MPN/PAD-1 n=1 Tax=Paenibacillus beijingensis TaxID=1126833 RepID=A0A0D5NGH4_9BACL|nr:M67 family metallopeptidase [Paenibacillus beijingensis]AJY74494.1 Mov34/MPN/PAD-1 [Paenibacillus beijingensis]